MRIVLTGSGGFVGRALLTSLIDAGHVVMPLVHVATAELDRRALAPVSVDLTADPVWAPIVQDQDCVVHVAARVHILSDTVADPMVAFREVNTMATLKLARAAALAHVRRFVFLSTIKVNGETTPTGRPFTVWDSANPTDPYAISKHEAEVGLQEIGRRFGMEVVIVRSPLVYGPGVQGNFSSLLRWLDRGVPLPFGLVTENRRSLVALGNLVDLLVRCVEQPEAANQVLLVSDGEDLSTAALLRRLAASRGARARLVPVPVQLLVLLGRMMRQHAVIRRLCDNLQVDITQTRQRLGWAPIISVDEGLRRTRDPIQTDN